MARIARVIAPGCPHHITQRGNRRQVTFFCEEDYRFYLELMSEWLRRYEVETWAYCLMPNHVHLIAVPKTQEGLARAIGEAHRRYTRRINFREGWRGHLWQDRFASFPMDETYLLAAVRYVEMNPVASGLVAKPEDYAWSSARAHIEGEDDLLVHVAPLLEIVGNWEAFLGYPKEQEMKNFQLHEKTGRPLGTDMFINRLENQLVRTLRPQKPGPRSKERKS
ncbi:MAG: Transposase IS200 like protein [Syntrophus sp. PtaU1.Bin208]|nr:MAG: Transposase IS200 like protein [Syntrophus sp. PtaU1.Bin208]